MIFVRAKIRQVHLCPLFLLAVISITSAYGQESGVASFSLESNVLIVPAIEVQGLGSYKIELNLIEGSRFKLTTATKIDQAMTENVYQTATAKMILPKVAVLQGGIEIARYELHLWLEDSESQLFGLVYVNKLSLLSSSGREQICSDYGCFELQTKLVGQDDGEISASGDRRVEQVFWGRNEIKNISARQSLPSFSNIERVGQQAAPNPTLSSLTRRHQRPTRVSAPAVLPLAAPLAAPRAAPRAAPTKLQHGPRHRPRSDGHYVAVAENGKFRWEFCRA